METFLRKITGRSIGCGQCATWKNLKSDQMMASIDAQKLKQDALKARENAHAPYSNFRVGAALLEESGQIITGCNVENSTYGLTICAERVAIFKAISEGYTRFKAIAVAADSKTLTPPCGACRQIIWEFCGDIPVYLVNVRGEEKQIQMKELFPSPFDHKQIS